MIGITRSIQDNINKNNKNNNGESIQTVLW